MGGHHHHHGGRRTGGQPSGTGGGGKPAFGHIIFPATAMPVPVMELRATAETARMLRNLSRPEVVEVMKSFFREALYEVGRQGAKIARAVLLGAPLGAQIEAAMPRAKESTRDLRRRNRSPHPLLEFGHLARNIVAQPGGNFIVVGVRNTAKQRARPNRPHSRPLQGGLAQLALNLEGGFNIDITPKAVSYFKARASESRGSATMYGDLGSRSWASLHSREAAAWAKLAKHGVGKIAVPPRPFLRPSVEKAIEEVSRSAFDKAAEAFVRFWVTGQGASTKVGGVAATAEESAGGD